MDINDVFNKLIDKNNKMIQVINKIKELKIVLNNEQIDELSNININMKDNIKKINKLYYEILDKNDIFKSLEDLENIKKINIENKINKIILPYILLLQIGLDN